VDYLIEKSSSSTTPDPATMFQAEGSEGGSLMVLKINALAEIFMNAPVELAKPLLNKIKASETYEVNRKAISACHVPDLKESWFYLRGSGVHPTDSEINDGINQVGLVSGVLREVNKLLPYKCETCANVVTNKRTEIPEVMCQGCGIGACTACFPSNEVSWSFLCPPCGTFVDNKKKVPVNHLKAGFIKKHSVKPPTQTKKKAGPQTAEEDVPELDETDEEMQPGQSTPLYQSTQLETSVTVSSGFPDINFTDVTISQGEASGSGVVSGAEVVTEEVSEDSTANTEEEFIVPPKRARADYKKLKKTSSNKEVGPAKLVQSQSSDGESSTTDCRFFMRGACKFGFFGKGKGGQGRCPYRHPKPCRRLMENGAGDGGCLKGKECESAHPRICHQSLTSRTCKNIKDGGRCSSGYHVRGTKAPVTKPLATTTAAEKGTSNKSKKDSPKQPWSAPPQSFQSQERSSAATTCIPNLGDQQLALSSVFGELIRAEVVKLLQNGTLWPQRISQQGGQAVSPPVPPPVLRGLDSTISMGSLGALLSLMGSQHQ
jgi:hypothetical protein